jgi:signal transduction histidine kinase
MKTATINDNGDRLSKEMSILEVLKTSNIFEGLGEPMLAKIAAISHEQIHQPGEIIFTEGDIAQNLYILKEGKVALDANLSTRPGSVKRGTIEIILPGEAFGWSAILRSRLTMGARAISRSETIAVDGKALHFLLAQDTATSAMVMRKVVNIVDSRLAHTRITLAHFLSVASHDLKSPLAAVQSYLQVILGGFVGELNEKQREMLSRSCVRIAEFIGMIDNILDISRFEVGEIEAKELSLSDVVKDSVETLRPLAEQKKLNVTLDLPQETPKTKGSATRLKQVITNLVGNAIKFTSSPGEISVRLEEDDDYLKVAVADTGQGISNEDLPKIFDDFYRGVAGDTAAKGAGLGLSISKMIVEAHGGRIWAESPCPETGSGTKFVFTLPKDKDKTKKGERKKQ